MSTYDNWPINTGRDGIAATATAVSQAVDLTAGGDMSRRSAPDVLIDNPGPADVFVAAGGPGVVATVLSVRVPPGSMQPYEKGTASHVAVVCAAGQSQYVVIHVGDGA